MTDPSPLFDPSPAVAGAAVAVALLFVGLRIGKARLALLAGSALLSFAVAEGVSRLAGFGKPALPVWSESRDRAGPAPYVPGTELRYSYPDNPRGDFDAENSVRGTINSLGFRGAEIERAKRPGTTRVAFLGDSFTLGIGVGDEDTLPAQVKRNLKSVRPQIEVLNFGVSGLSTTGEIQVLERFALDFAPDVVVLVYFLNDAGREGTVRFLGRPRLLPRVRQRSWFLNGAIGGVERIVIHRQMVARYFEGYEAESVTWRRVRGALRRGQRSAGAKGAEFVVAIYPVLFRLDDRHPFRSIHEQLVAFCASESIPVVDLLPAFLGQSDRALWVHAIDQHPNGAAHALAAKRLAEFLVSSGMLPSEAAGGGEPTDAAASAVVQ